MADEKTEKAKAPKGDKAAAPKGEGKARAPRGQAPTAERTASASDLAAPKDYVARLRKHYDEVVRPALIKEFGYKNPLEVPRVEKIVRTGPGSNAASHGVAADRSWVCDSTVSPSGPVEIRIGDFPVTAGALGAAALAVRRARP